MSRRNSTRALCAAALTLTAGWSTAADPVVKYVVAPVVGVWPAGDEFTQLHKDLSDAVKGVPDLETFRAKERWIVVWHWTRPEVGYSLKARASDVEPLTVGDIVEITFLNRLRDAETYADLSRVVRVMCRKLQPDFSQCSKGVTLGKMDESHQPIK